MLAEKPVISHLMEQSENLPNPFSVTKRARCWRIDSYRMYPGKFYSEIPEG